MKPKKIKRFLTVRRIGDTAYVIVRRADTLLATHWEPLYAGQLSTWWCDASCAATEVSLWTYNNRTLYVFRTREIARQALRTYLRESWQASRTYRKTFSRPVEHTSDFVGRRVYSRIVRLLCSKRQRNRT